MIKNENYLQIQGWMINELKLKGNELMIFAIIYGFTQDGIQWFEGSRQYLADWCNSTKQGIQKNLKALVEKKLLIKEDVILNNVKFCKYRANLDLINNNDTQSTKLSTPVNKVDHPSQQSCPNNTNNNTSNNNIVSKKEADTKSYDDILHNKLKDEELINIFKEFIKMRKMIKAPLTNKALELSISKIHKLAPGDIEKQKEIVNQSVMNSWKGLFPLREDKKKQANNFNQRTYSQEDFNEMYANKRRIEASAYDNLIS